MHTLANIIREADKFQRGKIHKHFPQSVLNDFCEYLRGTFQASALQSTKYNSASESEVKSLSRVRPSATPWTAAFQAPPSMGFSRQEYTTTLLFL